MFDLDYINLLSTHEALSKVSCLEQQAVFVRLSFLTQTVGKSYSSLT